MISTTENLAGRQAADFTIIERHAAAYDQACQNMDILIAELEHDLEGVKAKHLRGLKKQAAIVANLEAELHGAIERQPGLFEKPRTVTLHGIKVGMSNSIGEMTWNDKDQVLKLIQKHFPDRFDELVKTERTPRKDALRTLSEANQAKIGCRIEGAGDQVLINRLAGEVEKMFNKIIDKLVSAMIEEE